MQISEERANRPPRGSSHNLVSAAPSPTHCTHIGAQGLVTPSDSGGPLNSSNQAENKPWEPCAVFIKSTDLYFSSAFQMSCVLLNAHKIHWRGRKWLTCTNSVPETHSQDNSLLPPGAVSLVLGCPCSYMKFYSSPGT